MIHFGNFCEKVSGNHGGDPIGNSAGDPVEIRRRSRHVLWGELSGHFAGEMVVEFSSESPVEDFVEFTVNFDVYWHFATSVTLGALR